MNAINSSVIASVSLSPQFRDPLHDVTYRCVFQVYYNFDKINHTLTKYINLICRRIRPPQSGGKDQLLCKTAVTIVLSFL